MVDYDLQYHSVFPSNQFNNVDLETRGVYLVSHDAFKIPPIDKGELSLPYIGGGLRLSSNFEPKSINITLKVDNSYTSESILTPDQNLRAIMSLLWTTKPVPLILEERPDRYIDVIVSGAIQIKDEVQFTTIEVPLLAPLPFFQSVDSFEYPGGKIISPGNAPFYPVITIFGIRVNPTITVVNSLGTVRCSYTGSLGAEDTLTIDCLNQTCKFNNNNIGDLLTGGYPVFQPGLNTITTTAPTIKVSGRWLYY